MTNSRPGEPIRKILETMPPQDHGPILAYLEQKNRHGGDKDILEAVLDYRRMMEGKPHLRLITNE